ncbi:MAG: TonB-dependent receptor plug domain-containing protein [Vicinamibacterales bacterium]
MSFLHPFVPRGAAWWSGLLPLAGVLLALPAAAAAQVHVNLEQATLEDLLNIEVTSASKKEEGLFQTAAAVHVLTNEDIRRSGATNLPDVLRLVPGLHVATIDGNKWAVSARGFNGLWSNKLLVIVDGRVVYTPVSSGVYWDLLDLMLEDIDRIEVVRGPGASVWGANAVNGVINVISKAADATQGSLLSVNAGSLTPGIGAFRYGGRVGSRGSYRVFGKHSARGAMQDDAGATAADASRISSTGFRVDFDRNTNETWTVLGSARTGESGQRIYEPLSSYAPTSLGIIDTVSPVHTGHLLARWTRNWSPDSRLSLQAFWDRTSRTPINKGETTQTFDFELQHQFKAGHGHDLVWGAGQRFWSDREDALFGDYFEPSSSRRRLFNFFVQDEITFTGLPIHLTFGTKIEHHSGAGVEVQPTARVAWLPSPRHTVWAAVSRAARTPSRLERALHYDFAAYPDADGQLTVLGVRGDPDLRTEHTVSFEAGYRANPGLGVSFEGTAFHHVYSDLVTENLAVRFETTPAPAHLAIVRQISSGMGGESVGAEALVRWRALASWTLDASLDWLSFHFHDVGDTPDAAAYADRNPAYQARVRSQINLPRAWQADAAWTYVAALKGTEVPSYGRLDIRIGRTVAGLELSLTGQNLSERRHREFGGYEGVFHSQVPRAWVGRATWSF